MVAHTEIIEDCEQSRSMLSYFFSTKKKKERKRSCPNVAIEVHRPACLWGAIQDGDNNDCQEDEEVEVDQLRSPFTDALILVAEKCFGQRFGFTCTKQQR